jgi:NADH dehydrogenase [ubiquinone] 1 alpha subcomplex assembly factor 7
VLLVELGPGRGTLMADALRAARVRPAFLAALQLHLVESNATLRERQRAALHALAPGAQWHDDFAAVPEGPLLLVANEFFDALPIHQFEHTPQGWRERLVAVDEADALQPALGTPTAAFALLSRDQRAAPVGSVAEMSPAALQLAARIGERIARHAGAALLIDYGHGGHGPDQAPWPASFRSAKTHRWQDPLADPGAADLTADVDFAALARAAGDSGAAVFGPVPQSVLLRRLGIETRAGTLRARAAGAEAETIAAALHRLLAPGEMGRLFKALAIVPPPGAPAAFGPPPGFEESDVIAD